MSPASCAPRPHARPTRRDIPVSGAGEQRDPRAHGVPARAGGEWFEQPWWEERYAARGPVWSGHVNPQLAVEAAGLEPARALDVGAGEGGDALWLAERGWQVTALDFAQAALASGRAAAEERGLSDRTAFRWADARTWQPGEERWDLVTSQFLHLPGGGMVDVVRRLAAAVAPGGTLLVVGHHPDDLRTGLRHGRAEWLFAPEDLLAALDGDGDAAWDVRTEVRDRLEGGDDHGHGEAPTAVRDSVLVAHRRA